MGTKKKDKTVANVKRNKISIVDFSSNSYEEKTTYKLEDCIPYKSTKTVSWINIENVPPANFLSRLGLGFDLHPIILEDIEDVDQRTKIEFFDDYIVVILKMLSLDESEHHIITEQVSLIMAKKFVITFQQGVEGDSFEAVRNLAKKDKSRLRNSGTDYLAYELINSIIDGYYKILDKFSDRLEVVEEGITVNPSVKMLKIIHSLKRELINMRKFIWPLREVISMMERDDSHLLKKETRIYLRDLCDRLVQVMDIVETYRDMLSSMLDIYLSGVSNKTNSVMKILTVFSSIFLPLTFIAGVWGMNFRYMPWISSQWGLPIVGAFMFLVAITMLRYFKKKGWL